MARTAAIFVALALLSAPPAVAQQPAAEARFAFVIGNDGYDGAELPTAANDAALVADALKTAGFDVTGARNLDQDTLRSAYREFLEKVSAAGPDAVAAIYLSGYGLQLDGENYFIPPGARVAREADLALNAVRISDLTRALGGLPARARIVMLDMAYSGPFLKEGQPLAPGLALVEPDDGMLISFNAAPGVIAPAGKPPYGAYAQALAEMLREAGLPVNDVFSQVRARVAELTKGVQAPWDATRLPDDFTLLERGADAPPPAIARADLQARRDRPLGELDPAAAYAAALQRDTIAGYESFLVAHPQSPYARNVRNMLAARREAQTWRRTTGVNTPNAYWSYLQRYPKGPHSADARRRLSRLQAAAEPPPSFQALDYGFAGPQQDETVYFQDDRRSFVEIDGPVADFAPPPPRWWRPPPPPVFDEDEHYFLAAPVDEVAPPAWVNRPSYLAEPEVIYREDRPGVRVNPYIAIPAALAAGIVAGKIIRDRRGDGRPPVNGRPPNPRQVTMPPVAPTAQDFRQRFGQGRGPQGQFQPQNRGPQTFQGGQNGGPNRNPQFQGQGGNRGPQGLPQGQGQQFQGQGGNRGPQGLPQGQGQQFQGQGGNRGPQGLPQGQGQQFQGQGGNRGPQGLPQGQGQQFQGQGGNRGPQGLPQGQGQQFQGQGGNRGPQGLPQGQGQQFQGQGGNRGPQGLPQGQGQGQQLQNNGQGRVSPLDAARQRQEQLQQQRQQQIQQQQQQRQQQIQQQQQQRQQQIQQQQQRQQQIQQQQNQQRQQQQQNLQRQQQMQQQQRQQQMQQQQQRQQQMQQQRQQQIQQQQNQQRQQQQMQQQRQQQMQQQRQQQMQQQQQQQRQQQMQQMQQRQQQMQQMQRQQQMQRSAPPQRAAPCGRPGLPACR